MARVMKGISLVFPAHNEGIIIYKMALETANVLDEHGLEYEIIVVDDGSTDDTPLGIEQVPENCRMSKTSHTREPGQGKCTKERVPRVYRRIDVHSVPREIHRPCNCNKTRHRGGRGHLLA